jgi:hypothetical protein
MPDGWRPQVRTRGLAQDDSRETVAVLHDGAAGPDVWTCRCPGCSTWNPQAMLGSLPPRFETSVLTRMGRLRPSPAADARRGRTRKPTRPPLGPRRRFAAASTDPECVGVSRGTGVSVPAVDARQYRTRGPVAMREQRCLMREQCGALRRWRSVIRTPTGHQDPRGIGPVLHIGCRADPGARTGPMFHVEPEAVFGGATAPSASNARTGCLMRYCGRPRGADVRRLGCPGPIRFHVELRRCSTVGATDSDVWTGWMFHVEPRGQCLVDGASRLGRQDRMTD